MKWSRVLPGFTLLCLLLPGVASAGPLDAYLPASGDALVDVLRQIFGGAVDSADGSTMFTKMLGVWSAAVMTIGVVLVTYNLVVGTMQTAHDGEMLGKRWSSLWVPIRSAVGFGLVTPLASGLSAIHLILIYLVMLGIGVANLTWQKGVEYMASGGYVVQPAMPEVRPLVVSVLRSETCRVAANSIAQSAGLPQPVFLHEVSSQDESTVYWASNISTMDACGGIKIRVPRLGVDDPNYGIYQAQVAATREMMASVTPLAQILVAGGMPDGRKIDEIASAYKAKILAAAALRVRSENAGDLGRLLSESRQGGIMYAANYSRSIAALNADLAQATAATPIAFPLTKSFPLEYQQELDFALARVDTYSARAGALSGDMTPSIGATDAAASNGDWLVEAIFSRINQPARAMITGMTGALTGSENAMARLQSAGHIISDGAMGILIALAGAGVAFGVTPAFAALQLLAGGLVMMIQMMLWGLYFFGLSLAYFLPMLPYVTWMLFLAGYLVLVLEAAIAAPLWMIAHIPASGEGLAGQHAHQGYMLVLSLVSRLALGVLGLVAGSAIMEVMVGVVGKTFAPMLMAAENGQVTGLGAIFAYTAILTGLLLAIAHRSIALIHIVPDRILRWIGGGGEQLGETEGGNETRQVFAGGMAETKGATRGMSRPNKPGAAGGGAAGGGAAGGGAAGGGAAGGGGGGGGDIHIGDNTAGAGKAGK